MPVPVRGGNQSYFLRRQSLENKKEFAGAVYHLTSRGNAQQAIFLDEKDFADFLGVLCQVVKRYHFLLPTYCLMNNHDHLNQEQKKPSSRYQAFVHSGIKAASPLKAIKGQLFLGQENFIDEIKPLMRGKEKLKEITREQRYLTRPALNEIFKRKDQKSKEQVMYEAHLQYGYTLKAIAEYIGVHYTTVSRAIKKIEGEDEK